MTYDELFQLKGLEKAKLLAGKSILGREISGAHVVEIVEAQDWVKRGELIFVSGVAFRDVKRDLTEAICELSKKQVAGVVLEVGPYIKEVTDDIIELANELNLPLLSLPYEIHVSEIISQIYYDKYSKEETNKSVEKFMTELLYEDEKKALERIELFKYNAEKKHIAVYVSVEAEDNSSQTKSVEKVNENGESKNENTFENSSINSKNADISEQLLRAVRMSFVRQNQLLYLKEEDGVAAVIELEAGDKVHKLMRQKRKEIEENLRYSRKNVSVNMGIGKVFIGADSIKKSVTEARKANKVIKTDGETGNLRYYDEIGIYRIFFNLSDDKVLRNLLTETLGAIMQYDDENGSDMVHTLEVFLEQGCNIAAATDALYVHRNTVKYRIKRIEEIMNIDLKDVTVQFNLRLAFKIMHYLG